MMKVGMKMKQMVEKVMKMGEAKPQMKGTV